MQQKVERDPTTLTFRGPALTYCNALVRLSNARRKRDNRAFMEIKNDSYF